MTRSQPLPPNPCSPDPRLPNSPRPLKTPRTTPLPQSPGSSIAHLRDQDRTPPLVIQAPPACRDSHHDSSYSQSSHPDSYSPTAHCSSIDNPPTPTTSPSLVRPNIDPATTRKTTHGRHQHHPYSRCTHNSPHASTCHICPDTSITTPSQPDMTPPPFLVNNPIQDSPPFNLDSHTDFPPILPSSSTNNSPTAREPGTTLIPMSIEMVTSPMSYTYTPHLPPLIPPSLLTNPSSPSLLLSNLHTLHGMI